MAALRSGDYVQGKGRLCTIDGEGKKSYCCLGVLCDLAARDGLVKTIGQDRDYPRPDFVQQILFDFASAYLPDSVADWADLPNDPEANEIPLIAWNDGYEKSFTEIANLIEQYL